MNKKGAPSPAVLSAVEGKGGLLFLPGEDEQERKIEGIKYLNVV